MSAHADGREYAHTLSASEGWEVAGGEKPFVVDAQGRRLATFYGQGMSIAQDQAHAAWFAASPKMIALLERIEAATDRDAVGCFDELALADARREITALLDSLAVKKGGA